MNKKRKKFYQNGLKTWEKRLTYIKKALRVHCPVCDVNNCHQHFIGEFHEDGLAIDCPIRAFPKLCAKMSNKVGAIVALETDIWRLIQEIKEAHEKAGI